MSDADRLARKKAAKKRGKIPPPTVVMMCPALGDKLPTTPEGKAALQDIANAAAKIADRMTVKATERAPKRGKWTLCTACDAIAAGHVFTPCARCGSTSTARFKDGKPIAKKQRVVEGVKYNLSAGDSVPDEISAPLAEVSEPKADEPTQPSPPPAPKRRQRKGAAPPPQEYEW